MLTPVEHAAIVAHAVQTFPKECVGFVLRRRGESRVMACRNAAWAPAETFLVAPVDHVRLLGRQRAGWIIAAVYHSHPDSKHAALSPRDAAAMAPKGQPAFPGALQVIVGCDAMGPTVVNGFVWDPVRQTFILAGTLRYLDVAEGRRTSYRQLVVLPLVKTDEPEHLTIGV